MNCFEQLIYIEYTSVSEKNKMGVHGFTKFAESEEVTLKDLVFQLDMEDHMLLLCLLMKSIRGQCLGE